MSPRRPESKHGTVSQRYFDGLEQSSDMKAVDPVLQQSLAEMRRVHAEAMKLADRLRHDEQLHRIALQAVMLVEDLIVMSRNARER